MRDLVESVIDDLMRQERLQQHRTQQKLHHDRPASSSRPINPIHLQHGGNRIAAADKERDPALWKVSRQFESIFLQQMMSEMRRSVQKSDFLPSGFAEDVHASMMDEAIAGASVKQHSFGIADAIYRQLERTQSTSEAHAAGSEALRMSSAIQGISASADRTDMDHQRVEDGNDAH